jgi:integrase/recombinase XerD
MLREKRIVPRLEPTPDPSAGNPLHVLQANFLEWTLSVGLAEQTANIRRVALDYYIRWCDVAGVREPGQISRQNIEQYQRHLFRYRKANGDPLALSTQATRLHPIKAFCRWLVRERLLPIDPSRELELPRLPRRLPRWVPSVPDVERILSRPDATTPSGVRDRAILEVLYSTALRRMELVRLQEYDVDLANRVVMVRAGKGGRDRIVPLGAQAAKWVGQYVLEVRPRLVTEGRVGHLFLTDYGEPFGKNRLGDMVRRYLVAARMRAPGACHVFRHACATHMLENGADIRFIQSMLGHADLSTTQIYTRVSIAKLKDVHAATHPRGRGATDSGEIAERPRRSAWVRRT